MSVTINPTLPQEWQNDIVYEYGDQVVYGNQVSINNKIIYQSIYHNTDDNKNINKNPISNQTYWKALDIYKKDNTVMPHGQYSGDDSFWDRDEVKVTETGQVLINNENTGINVRGPVGAPAYIRFEDLTQEQIEALRGYSGTNGTDGTIYFDDLTPAQKNSLKGETGAAGKSSYQLWLDEGHTGTIDDYFSWIMQNAITVDTQLDPLSTNPVQNQAIAQAFESYKLALNEYVKQCNQRITDLENRLKYTYDNVEHFFRFGITQQGQYGYYYNNSANILPFNINQDDLLMSANTQMELGVTNPEFGSSDYSSNVSMFTLGAGPHTSVLPTSMVGTVSNEIGEDDTNTVFVTQNMYDFNEYEWSKVKSEDVTDQLLTFGFNNDLTTTPYPKGSIQDPEAVLPDVFPSDRNEGWTFFIGWMQPGDTRHFMYGVTLEPVQWSSFGEYIGVSFGQFNKHWENSDNIAHYYANGGSSEAQPYAEAAGLVTTLGNSFTEETTFYIHAGHNLGWYLLSWVEMGFFTIKNITGYYIDEEGE